MRSRDQLDIGDCTKGNEVPLRCSHPQAKNVVYSLAVGRIRLNLDLPGAAKTIEVVDVSTSHRGLQCAEDVVDRHPQRLGAFAVKFQIDLRGLGSIGRVDIGERGVLVGRNEEPSATAARSSGVAPESVCSCNSNPAALPSPAIGGRLKATTLAAAICRNNALTSVPRPAVFVG